MAEMNLEIPKIWKELLKKKEWLGEGDIAGCFCPGFDDGKEWFSNYFGTDDLALLSRLVYLGQADGTGAAYAILIVDEKKPLEESRILGCLHTERALCDRNPARDADRCLALTLNRPCKNDGKSRSKHV